MEVAYLCDFDGTISPTDIGAEFMRRFSTDRSGAIHELLARWDRGEIGSRELTAIECGWLAVTEDEALSFTRGFTLDADFPEFVREVKGRGAAVAVVSDGLDFYVRDHLRNVGLGDLPWTANGARFVNGGVRAEFPPSAGCGRCGNCKGAHVERWRERGYRVVMIGDGLSDRCGARLADQVIARGSLLAWCREQGIAATPFDGFAGVIRAERGRAAAERG
jgi:2,3-diketo-5-methylthio-1-phosphopentane phosphatase